MSALFDATSISSIYLGIPYIRISQILSTAVINQGISQLRLFVRSTDSLKSKNRKTLELSNTRMVFHVIYRFLAHKDKAAREEAKRQQL